MSGVPGRVLLADEATMEALASVIDPRYRALLILLRFTALRWAEAVALRRRRCFVREGSIEVAEHVVETRSGPRFRSLARDCGWVAVRDGVKDALAEHLARYVAEGPDAVVFTDSRGGPLVRRHFEEAEWLPALRALGLPDVEMGIDTLGSARLWGDIREATSLRASYAEGWRRGGGLGA
ncbi:MAG TPA: hypothetical protein VET24_11585 [Actinomycetota bacterium]|nr:hypothetical protein [Actinomycetota bacterium]